MTPMMNMYDTIRANLHFNKFVVGELLFVEYQCPIEQENAAVAPDTTNPLNLSLDIFTLLLTNT
jgi:hypothetical protein